ncbi:isopentenyl-diphosphate Delta-isomerase [Novipirellula sp. SH528]|uniref:isopentenyl-diphosphate Delta-isomerase n=1 Tax=Novipirellula sp. SH528 TaxID=3454466 RepID=UPI003FA0011F
MNPNEVIIVNNQDEVLGYMSKLEAHEKGVLHRAISVFVFTSNFEWLVQKRADHKYHSGGLWSNTSCTHPMKGESSIDAARRRLTEEMGLDVNLKKAFTFQYTASLDNNLIEKELDHIFVGQSNVPPIINKEEVVAYRYINTVSLAEELKMHPEHFTEWFRLLFDRVRQEIEKGF